MLLVWIGELMKLQKIRRLNKMKILIIFLMFFVIGALFIISNNSLAMYKKENSEKFSELYIQWIDQIYINSQKLTGEAIKLDWLPK